MLLDDVAADFPELTIVMAHPAVPWVDAQISIATHKPNVYIDLSGWSPKYFPPQLVRAANRQLRTKVLFGTDYPYIELDRWRRDFETLDMDPSAAADLQGQRPAGPRGHLPYREQGPLRGFDAATRRGLAVIGISRHAV